MYFRALGNFRKEVLFLLKNTKNLNFLRQSSHSNLKPPLSNREYFSITMLPLVLPLSEWVFPISGQKDPSWRKRMMKHVSNISQGLDSDFLCKSFLFPCCGKARLIKGVELQLKALWKNKTPQQQESSQMQLDVFANPARSIMTIVKGSCPDKAKEKCSPAHAIQNL